MPSNHLILCRPLLLLPSIFPSTRVFSYDLALCIRWPKYWSFSFSISPPMNIQDWFPLGMTGRISLQSKGLSRVSNTTVQKHQFFSAQFFLYSQLSHPSMTTGKTIALTRRTFVDKVMSLFFNILSRFVIAFLPRSKHLLISWLQSPSAVILEPPQNKVCYCFHCFPIYLPWSDGTGCHDLSFLKVKSLNCVRLFATPWTVACKDPLSMGFFRQEYWSGLPFPSPGDLPNPGIEPRSPSL